MASNLILLLFFTLLSKKFHFIMWTYHWLLWSWSIHAANLMIESSNPLWFPRRQVGLERSTWDANFGLLPLKATFLGRQTFDAQLLSRQPNCQATFFFALEATDWFICVSSWMIRTFDTKQYFFVIQFFDVKREHFFFASIKIYQANCQEKKHLRKNRKRDIWV